MLNTHTTHTQKEEEEFGGFTAGLIFLLSLHLQPPCLDQDCHMTLRFLTHTWSWTMRSGLADPSSHRFHSADSDEVMQPVRR